MKTTDSYMKTVGIWGCGVVGSNTARLFKEYGGDKVKVLEYDKYKKGNWTTPEEIAQKSDFIFLCLPTPMEKDGSVNLEYVTEALKELSENIPRENDLIIIIRSTMIPGSTDKFLKLFCHLNIAFMPEFLVETNPWKEVERPSRIIIGTADNVIFLRISSLFLSVYKHPVEYINMTCAEAEIYKYACNTLLAVNVLTANEIYFICKENNIDYGVIQKYFKLDPRIGTHTLVPGTDGDFGVGGKCLPKDVSALCHYAESHGYEPILLKAALQLNDRVRITKDWMNIPGAVSSCLYEKEN